MPIATLGLERQRTEAWFCVALLVWFGVPPILALAFASNAQKPHKSDKEMIEIFHAHRRDFERLVSMIVDDNRLLRVDSDWTVPTDPEAVGVPQARIEEYRRVMERLGISRGLSADEQRKDIKFTSTAEGYVTHGSTKGYLYTKVRPAELDADLDKVIEDGEFYGYRHIEGNWYLFYEKY